MMSAIKPKRRRTEFHEGYSLGYKAGLDAAVQAIRSHIEIAVTLADGIVASEVERELVRKHGKMRLPEPLESPDEDHGNEE